MCGRYVAASTPAEIAAALGVEDVVAEDLGPHWNVAPTMDVYAVATTREGTARLGTFRWGLVPSWSKDPGGGAKMINARAETVAEKPAFRTALAKRRCLLPADGFYEWRRGPGGPKDKTAFHIRRAGGGLLVFAGLWELWRDRDGPDGEWLKTCTIITTTANAEMAPLHDRMPVILDRQQQALWLDTAGRSTAAVLPLLAPLPEGQLELFAVDGRVGNVKNDDAGLVVPATNLA